MNADVRERTLLVKTLVKCGVVELTIAGGVLFGIAGRVDWPAAWLVILLFTGHLVLSGWLLLRRDPELLKERLTTASNVPQGDRLIARANRILLPIFLATAALDAGRFGWSAMPMIVRAIGMAAVVAAIGVVYWSAAANHFLSARSRIQSEHGHTVVQHGPYRFVRHPICGGGACAELESANRHDGAKMRTLRAAENGYEESGCCRGEESTTAT